MGVAIPQIISEDKASGALVIDGSLKFDTSKDQYLIRTPSSSGNRKTFTFSAWFKRGTQPGEARVFNAASATDGGSSNPRTEIGFGSGDLRFNLNSSGSSWSSFDTSSLFRDSSAWYHIVWVLDTTQSTGNNQRKIYVNGVLQTALDNSGSVTQNQDTPYNTANYPHILGGYGNVPTENNYDGLMSQVYFIDGQALDPSYFGYTDPLTNTWRPKKFNGSFTSTRTENATLNTSFATSPPTDSTGTTTLTTQNISTQTASTNSFGVTTSTLFSGTTQYSRVLTNATVGSSAPFTIDFIAKFVQSGSSSYFCEFANGNAIIQTDNPAANTTCLLWGSVSFSLSYGWHSIRVQWDGSRSKLWVDGTLTLDVSNAPGASSGSMTIGAHPTLNVRTFNGEFGPFRLTPSALGAPKSGGLLASDFTNSTTLDNPNSFYLPLDGNTPIGQDQSGRGNNWTPVNFGGSNTIEKATGALPILNTDGGGKVARVGVRTDAFASNLVLALPLVGIKSDFSNKINSGTTEKIITVNNSSFISTESTYYGGSAAFNGVGGGNLAGASYFSAPASSNWNFGTGDATIEAWVNWNGTTEFGARVLYGNGGSGSSEQWGILDTGQLIFMAVTSTTSLGTVPINQWCHLASVRTSGVVRHYINGLYVGGDSNSSSVGQSGNPVYVGTRSDGYHTFSGFMQDFRLYNGVAKYTGNYFNVGTPEPSVLPDTPSGVAYSSNVALIPSTDGAVAFDGSGDTLSIADSADFDVAAGDFTIEGYIYPQKLASYNIIFDDIDTNRSGIQLSINSSGNYQIEIGDGANNWIWQSTTIPVKGNNWSHIALTRSGSSFRFFVDGILQGSTTSSTAIGNPKAVTIGGWSSGSDYYFQGFISNFHFVKGTALYTSNFTPPTGPISSVANTKLLCCKSNSREVNFDVAPTPSSLTASFNAALSATPFTDGSSSAISITNTNSRTTTSAGTNSFNITNAASFPGGSGANLTLGSSINRTGLYTIDLYVKPTLSQQSRMITNESGLSGNTSGAAGQGISLATDGSINIYDYGDASLAPAGTIVAGNWYHLRFVFSNTTIVSSFVNGVRQRTTGSVQNFAANTALRIGWGESGTSHSFDGLMGPVRIVSGDLGNPDVGGTPTSSGTLSNTPTPSNIASYGNAVATNFNPFTVNINTQRGQESGWCTLDPLSKSSNCTLSDGNLRITSSSASEGGAFGNISVPIGSNVKYYFEMFVNNIGTDTSCHVGVANFNAASNYSGGNFSYYRDDGAIDGSSSYSSYTTGDTIGVAVDCLGGSVSYYKNGIFQKTSTISTYNIAKAQVMTRRTNGTSSLNFGQKPFKFPPPAGFQPLALANTSRPTIVRPDQYVGISTWTGNDVNNRKITLNFKPDLFWAKSRSSTPYHTINDSVRGVNAILQSNTTSAEQVNSNGYVTAFLSDGVTVTNGSDINSSSYGNYVGWAWKAGGSGGGFSFWKDDVGYATASAAGLTAGTITPTGASVNTKSGFSIIGYTGGGSGSNRTISHGLGKVPQFMIVKKKSATDNWAVYHQAIGNDYDLYLNGTGARRDYPSWGDTTPTSTVFTVGTTDLTNDSSNSFVAYIWAEIPGFSKFGSYTGNGSADGPTIVTGFRPRWILVKQSSGIENWYIVDSTRSSYNPSNNYILANSGATETSYDSLFDFLSNGFKVRGAAGANNTSSATYIYAAFAETPSFNLYGGQANAR